MRNVSLGARGGGRQLDGESELTLVAQDAQLRGPIFIFALRREFFAKLSDVADALAVKRGADIARFHAGLFRGRSGVDVANEDSFAIGTTEKVATRSAAISGIKAPRGLSAAEHHRP